MHNFQLTLFVKDTKIPTKVSDNCHYLGSDPAHKAQEGPNRPTVFVTNVSGALANESYQSVISENQASKL